VSLWITGANLHHENKGAGFGRAGLNIGKPDSIGPYR